MTDQAHQFDDFELFMTNKLFRATCPPALELSEYQQGLLSPAELTHITGHVQGCLYCQDELAQLQLFLQQPDPYLQPNPLATLRQHGAALMGRLVNAAQRLGQSGLTPAPVGLRGDAVGPLVYEAGDMQISIEIQNDAEHAGYLALFGLLINLNNGHNTLAELWNESGLVVDTPVDAIGNFAFHQLAPGLYELFIANEQLDIHIPDLKVQFE